MSDLAPRRGASTISAIPTTAMLKEMPDLALSVRQPWAWAIIHAGKRLENRTAFAISRGGMKPGRICIHASKGMTRDEYESANSTIVRIRSDRFAHIPRPDLLVRGAIIGTVAVTGKVNESTDPWFVGPWALTLENPEPLEEPIPVGGELGYFEWKKNIGQLWSAKAVEAPLAWMTHWPERPPRPPTKAARERDEQQRKYEEALRTKPGASP